VANQHSQSLEEIYTQLHAATRRQADYESIFALSGDFAFIYAVTSQGELLREWLSASFERITGYMPDEIDPQTGWLEYIHPADRHRANEMLTIALAGHQITEELRFFTRSGPTRWLRFTMHPRWNTTHNRIVRIFGIAQDITDEKALQDQQSQFIANAMHELAHPVSSILMRLYLMRKQPDQLETHLDALEPVAERLSRMIEDMRELTYLERQLMTLELRQIDFSQLVAQAIQAQDTPELQLMLEAHAGPLPVLVDSDRIIRALHYVLNDVQQHTLPGERVLLETSELTEGRQQYARLVIYHCRSDVPHPTVTFYPFQSASQGQFTHTGLELAIARSIFQLHGGDIGVDTDAENCSAFTVRLKLAQL
jgi:PAS domain S-box-containing protein